MSESLHKRKAGEAVVALAVLVVAIAAAFWPILIGHETFWFYDVVLFHYPNYTALKQALAAGDLSGVIWNPDLGTGFPLWAEGQIGGLYPLNWILISIFEPLAAYNAAQVVHYVLAAAFMFAYARVLNLRVPSAAVAALAFTFSGHLVGAMAAHVILRSAVWLPLAFFGVERFARCRRFVYLATAGVGLAMQVLAGYPATAALGGTAVACYALFRFLWRREFVKGRRSTGATLAGHVFRALVAVGLIGSMAFALAAAHLVPQAELVARSGRTQVSYEYATSDSLPPIYLGTLIWPLMFHNPVERVVWGFENLGRAAIYVGIIPLALAAVAITTRRHRSRWAGFFVVMASLFLVLALGRYTPLYRWVYRLPGFSNFRAPSTFGYLFDFSMALLAGQGLDLLLARRSAALPTRVLVLGALLLLLVMPLLAWQVGVQRWAATGELAEVFGSPQAWLKPGRDPALLLRSIQTAADPHQPSACMPLILLAVGAAWLLWWCVRPGGAWVWAGVGLVAVDLVFFAASIRRTQVISPEALSPQSWVADVLEDQAGTHRAAVTYGLYPWYDSHQANRLLVDGVETLQVYTPLRTKRLSQYLALLRGNRDAAARLLALAGVHHGLDTGTQVHCGVPFIVKRPLATIGLWRKPQARMALPYPMRARRIQLVFAVTGWPEPDGRSLARITAVSQDGDEQDWVLFLGATASQSERWATVQPIGQSALRDPLSWHGEDFSTREWPLYYGLIEVDGDWALKEIRLETEPRTTLYLLGLVVESDTDRWAAGEQPFGQEGFSLVYQHPHGAIYRVDDALPRAYVVHKVRMVEESEVLEVLLDPSFDPRREAAVSRELRSVIAPVSADGDVVQIVAYSPTRVDLTVDAVAPGLLVLTDAAYPGWEAFVDGVEQPIIATNHLFRGVEVNSGSHQVVFVYRPISIRIGIAISLAAGNGVIGLLLLELVWRGRRRRDRGFCAARSS